VREAHTFLQEQGCINAGLLQGDPLAEPTAPEAVDEERVAVETLKILRSVDMAVRAARRSSEPAGARSARSLRFDMPQHSAGNNGEDDPQAAGGRAWRQGGRTQGLHPQPGTRQCRSN